MEISKRGQISAFVIIILSLAILISGVLLIKNISKVTAALPSPKEYLFESSVFPEKGQLGTVFTIKAALGVNKSEVYRIDAQIMKDNILLTEIPLLDDGMHGDSKADDGIYANTFDSSGHNEGVYYVDIKINPIENADAYKKSASFQVFRQNCVNLKYTGNPSDKIDVVFLASGYKDMKKFSSDVVKYVDITGKNKGLFSMEPFKSNADKFNIYLINQTGDLGCSLGCQGIDSMICCDDNKVSEFASQCPSDQIVVLHDTNEFCGTASSYAKVCTISRGAEVLTHEFGHSFGGFGDEYDYSEYYPTYDPGEYKYPNCDEQGCPKWINLGLQGVGCFKGCGVSAQFKPTDCDCIMCGYVGHYDPVDAIYLKKLMDNYSPAKSQGLAPPAEKAYMINLNYNYGQLKLNNLYLTQATAPDRKIVRKTDYKAKLISFSGENLYSFSFEMPRIEYPFYNPYNDTIRPSPIVYGNVDRMLAVPYYSDAKKMEVYDIMNRKVLEVDLTQYSSLCGDKICEQNENSVQCPQDCQEARKDSLCTYANDNVCDPDCLSVDPDCKKLNPLIIANAAAFAAFVILLGAILIIRKK